MKKSTRSYDRQNLQRVRRLRQDASISEDVLWRLIRNQKLGFKFKRQYPAGPYVLDFFCAEANLAVEVDGEQHEERRLQDAKRDAWAAERGIATLRLPSMDLFEYTGQVGAAWLRKIQETCELRAGRPAFPEPDPESEAGLPVFCDRE